MKKLIIIDGKSVFYRGYYAMGNLSKSDGTPTGGIYGFAVIALENSANQGGSSLGQSKDRYAQAQRNLSRI